MALPLFLLGSVACAGLETHLIRGSDGQELALDQALAAVQPGDIVVIGEKHAEAVCQNEELQVMRALRQRGLKVSVGMEFLEYPDQSATDQYRAGMLLEPDFLKTIRWAGFPFSFYRDQILFPLATEGALTLALNAPRGLTGHVAKSGLASLTADEQALLPPGLTRGSDRYFARFQDIMGGHVTDPAGLENYFMAQSIWDETMAWKMREGLEAHADQVGVVVVGEFHVQYGLGLPARLRARGTGRVWTLSFVDLGDYDAADRPAATAPDATDGPRADFVWSFLQTP